MISDAIKQEYALLKTFEENAGNIRDISELSDYMKVVSKRVFREDTFVFYPTALSELASNLFDGGALAYDEVGRLVISDQGRNLLERLDRHYIHPQRKVAA